MQEVLCQHLHNVTREMGIANKANLHIKITIYLCVILAGVIPTAAPTAQPRATPLPKEIGTESHNSIVATYAVELSFNFEAKISLKNSESAMYFMIRRNNRKLYQNSRLYGNHCAHPLL